MSEIITNYFKDYLNLYNGKHDELYNGPSPETVISNIINQIENEKQKGIDIPKELRHVSPLLERLELSEPIDIKNYLITELYIKSTGDFYKGTDNKHEYYWESSGASFFKNRDVAAFEKCFKLNIDEFLYDFGKAMKSLYGERNPFYESLHYNFNETSKDKLLNYMHTQEFHLPIANREFYDELSVQALLMVGMADPYKEGYNNSLIEQSILDYEEHVFSRLIQERLSLNPEIKPYDLYNNHDFIREAYEQIYCFEGLKNISLRLSDSKRVLPETIEDFSKIPIPAIVQEELNNPTNKELCDAIYNLRELNLSKVLYDEKDNDIILKTDIYSQSMSNDESLDMNNIVYAKILCYAIERNYERIQRDPIDAELRICNAFDHVQKEIQMQKENSIEKSFQVPEER